MQTFKPLRDRVLCRRVPTEEISPGGIHMPHSAQEKPIEGEIMGIGSGKLDEKGEIHPLEVAVGDRVLFGKYSGTEIKLNNEDFLILREEEILGIVRKQ